jgi:hypothetical protein
MLLEIRDFMQRERLASRQQLAREFQIDEQALQAMLDIWLKKGVITICDSSSKASNSCGSACSRCQNDLPIYYCYSAMLDIDTA